MDIKWYLDKLDEIQEEMKHHSYPNFNKQDVALVVLQEIAKDERQSKIGQRQPTPKMSAYIRIHHLSDKENLTYDEASKLIDNHKKGVI